ncbi:MAG: zf-HC2 domain-containing protein [Candidatus Aminicenantes bacterium]|nr:MAG: zf-HC2 domain-containing protein [Candidatus Aminicenantes bacterium]
MKWECFDQVRYTMFLDNELPHEERQRIEAHLETCSRCRELVQQMKMENTQIKEIFKTTHTPDLVPAVMDKLGTPGFSPGYQRYQCHQRHQRSRLIKLLNYRWMLAAAASVLLAGFLFIFLFLMTPTKPETIETRVILCSATVEGQEVQSHIYESTDPDIQFIWLEKEK